MMPTPNTEKILDNLHKEQCGICGCGLIAEFGKMVVERDRAMADLAALKEEVAGRISEIVELNTELAALNGRKVSLPASVGEVGQPGWMAERDVIDAIRAAGVEVDHG